LVEKVTMAIAGGATSAYLCSLDRNNKFDMRSTTTLRTNCFPVDYAVSEIVNRKLVLVAGSDVVEVRRLVEAKLKELNAN
jgi:hypothetical protein